MVFRPCDFLALPAHVRCFVQRRAQHAGRQDVQQQGVVAFLALGAPVRGVLDHAERWPAGRQDALFGARLFLVTPGAA
jgi:hypothetical protein